MSLHRYQTRRQTTTEEFPVEEIIGGSQASVCLCRRIAHRNVLALVTLYRTIQLILLLGDVVQLLQGFADFNTVRTIAKEIRHDKPEQSWEKHFAWLCLHEQRL